MINLPPARTADLVEQTAGAELLVYDLRINKTYLLNETSKNVFIACAEGTSVDELKRRHRYSDDLIHFALDELRAVSLIESETSNHFSGLSRRAVIKRVGLASMAALPVIAALTAPTSANASSRCPDPNSFGIPAGCPVGQSFLAGGADCSPATDGNRNINCDIIYGGQCQSNNAVYRPGSCSVEGGNNRSSCDCS